MVINSYYFNVGEKRIIKSHIEPEDKNNVIVITSGTYEIQKNGNIITSGNLTINENNLFFIFNANEVGNYELIERVTVGVETFITIAKIHVR